MANSGDGSGRETVTSLLKKISNGDKDAANRLVPLIYGDLRKLANHYIRNERIGHTLQPTALVHEAYLRIVDLRETTWEGRAHFIAVAATLMRRILLDHARRRLTQKRGGGGRDAGEDALNQVSVAQSKELVALDDALDRLAELDPRQSQIVEMRFFGGLSIEEIALTLELSSRTVKREWAAAKIWLHDAMAKR